MAKNFDYSNIFSAKNAVKLLKHSEINNHVIKLEENKQPFFKLIYSLKLIELKTLKTCIKINLANNIRRLFRSLAKISIFFF